MDCSEEESSVKTRGANPDRTGTSIGPLEGFRPDSRGRVLSIVPENPAAHFLLEDALGLAGRNQDATAQLEAAVQLQPDFADAHYRI